MAMKLVNESTSATVASCVELAVTRGSRRRGLLGRASLAPTAALVLSPCWSVHTLFMRFPIDVVFVDAHGRVVHLVPAMRPWRIAMCARARVVIELAAGAAGQRDLKVGDRVTLVETEHDSASSRELRALPLELRAC